MQSKFTFMAVSFFSLTFSPAGNTLLSFYFFSLFLQPNSPLFSLFKVGAVVPSASVRNQTLHVIVWCSLFVSLPLTFSTPHSLIPTSIHFSCLLNCPCHSWISSPLGLRCCSFLLDHPRTSKASHFILKRSETKAHTFHYYVLVILYHHLILFYKEVFFFI